LKSRPLLLVSFIKDDCRTMGTASLFANAVAAGIEAKLLYVNIDIPLDEDKLRSFFRMGAFGYVGISLTTRDYRMAVAFSRTIRKIEPGAFLFWGGIHPTSMPEECLDNDIDCVFIGEGEESLVSLIGLLEDGKDISGLRGVAIKKKGNYLINPPGFVENIDALHFPYYDFDRFWLLDDTCDQIRKFALSDYKRYSRHGGDGYTLVTSRSCPHSCSYCINSFINKLHGRIGRIRRRSVENTLVEIQYAIEHIPSVEFVNFMDDHFLIGDDWLDDFCEAYPKSIGLPFIIRATPESLTERRVEKLKSCGLKVVQMGIQSASERTHKEIFHRHFSRPKIMKAATLLHKYGIKGMYDFIIGNEFETDEEKESTILLMMQLPKPYDASVFHIIPFPKTDIVEFYATNKITPRLNPYDTGYFDFGIDDFYANLASLVPHTDNETIRHFLANKANMDIRDTVFRLSRLKGN
jgi:radical SAM superfamily enzyme YgiQ (UPF0313 family)